MNPPFDSLPFMHSLGGFAYPVLGLVILWTIIIKGFALWRAARNSSKIWFVVLLIVNSLGILELLYLFVFSKKEMSSSVPPSALGV